MLTLALAENREKSHICPATCTFIEHKTKIGRTMVAKKFQLPYTAVILLPLKLQKIDCAIRAFNKFTVLRGGTLELTDIATFVIQLYSIFSKTQ